MAHTVTLSGKNLIFLLKSAFSFQ